MAVIFVVTSYGFSLQDAKRIFSEGLLAVSYTHLTLPTNSRV